MTGIVFTVSVFGKSGLSIITCLMGLILAVVGTQMVIVGVTTAFKMPAVH